MSLIDIAFLISQLIDQTKYSSNFKILLTKGLIIIKNETNKMQNKSKPYSARIQSNIVIFLLTEFFPSILIYYILWWALFITKYFLKMFPNFLRFSSIKYRIPLNSRRSKPTLNTHRTFLKISLFLWMTLDSSKSVYIFPFLKYSSQIG